MTPLQIAENLSAAGLDHPAVDDAVIKLTNWAKAEPVAWLTSIGVATNTPPLADSPLSKEWTPLYAHPSRGVVDEDAIERLAKHLGRRGGPCQSYNADACRNKAREYLQAAALPAVPSVPEGLRVVGRVQRGPAPHDPLYALILPGVDDSTIPEGTPLYALAATPAHDQPEGSNNG